MSEKIEPVLDSESWMHRELAMGDRHGDMLFAYVKPETGKMHMGWNGEPLRPVKYPLALAALALNDYFTREDVELLRYAATWRLTGDEEVVAKAYGLADRIEALLPPEK